MDDVTLFPGDFRVLTPETLQEVKVDLEAAEESTRRKLAVVRLVEAGNL